MIWPFARNVASGQKFELNSSGRPIRPRFSSFHHLQDAPKSDRILALDWAVLWTGLPDIDHVVAADILDRLLMWQVQALDRSNEALVAEVAQKALWQAKEEFATSRTARALKHVCFENTGCDASETYSGRILPATKRPVLPLSDCTADLCRCRIRQIGNAEYRRITAKSQCQNTS